MHLRPGGPSWRGPGRDRATDAVLSVAGGLGQRPGGWRGGSRLGRLNELTQCRNAGLLQQVAGAPGWIAGPADPAVNSGRQRSDGGHEKGPRQGP